MEIKRIRTRIDGNYSYINTLELQFSFTLICKKVGGVNKEKLATDYLLLQ